MQAKCGEPCILYKTRTKYWSKPTRESINRKERRQPLWPVNAASKTFDFNFEMELGAFNWSAFSCDAVTLIIMANESWCAKLVVLSPFPTRHLSLCIGTSPHQGNALKWFDKQTNCRCGEGIQFCMRHFRSSMWDARKDIRTWINQKILERNQINSGHHGCTSIELARQ